MSGRTLILGGVRSGKSRLAERLARESGLAVSYLATAQPGDEEMRQRIAAHRRRRPPDWQLIEEPLALAATIACIAAPDRCLLVECLTLWLTNWLLQVDLESESAAAALQSEIDALLNAVAAAPGQLLLVGNETNLGIVPLDALSRRFCDLSGILHQELAARCDQVILTVAGLPLIVKTPHRGIA